MSARTPIAGGVVVPVDQGVAGGPNLDVDADVTDGRGTVVVPGIVAAHQHTWETIPISRADGIRRRPAAMPIAPPPTFARRRHVHQP